MKASLCIIIALMTLSLSSYSLAGCGSCGGSCDDDDIDRISYTSTCDCTDPGCGPFGYNNCLSANDCCEAFGNVGAR